MYSMIYWRYSIGKVEFLFVQLQNLFAGFVSTQEFNLLLALKHLFVVFVTRALFTHQVNTVGLNYQQTTASQNSGN